MKHRYLKILRVALGLVAMMTIAYNIFDMNVYTRSFLRVLKDADTVSTAFHQRQSENFDVAAVLYNKCVAPLTLLICIALVI